MSFRRGRNGFSEIECSIGSDLDRVRLFHGGSESEIGITLTMEYCPDDLGEENDVVVTDERWRVWADALEARLE